MKQTVVGAAVLAAGAVLVGLGVFGGVTRLDEADKWGSVIAALVAVLGLPVTVYGVVLARRAGRAPGGQSVTGSVVGGGVAQVRGVRGTVRIGGAASPAPAAGPPDAAPESKTADPGELGGQTVAGSWTAGPVRQVADVGGDADIDR